MFFFSLELNNFMYLYFIVMNLFLPMIISVVLMIMNFMLKMDFQSYFLGYLVLLLMGLEMGMNIYYFYFLSDTAASAVIFIGDYFVWDFMSSFNKIMILIFAFLILWYVEDSLKLEGRWFIDNFKQYGFYFVSHKEWYVSLKFDIFIKFKFIFFFIIMNILILILFSKDLFLIAFLFEMSTVCFTFLFFNPGFKSKEALLKFFIYSAVMNSYFFLVYL